MHKRSFYRVGVWVASGGINKRTSPGERKLTLSGQGIYIFYVWLGFPSWCLHLCWWYSLKPEAATKWFQPNSDLSWNLMQLKVKWAKSIALRAVREETERKGRTEPRATEIIQTLRIQTLAMEFEPSEFAMSLTVSVITLIAEKTKGKTYLFGFCNLQPV